MPKHPQKTDPKKKVKNKAQKPPKTETENAGETTTKKTRGAKSRYDDKVKPYLEKIALYVRCGVTEKQLQEYYDVGSTQWWTYKRKYPEFAETLYKATQDFKFELINEAYKIAHGYEYTEVKTVEEKDVDGKVLSVVTTTQKRYAKADAAMLQFLLINRFPAEFARDPQTVELRKKALAQNKSLPFEDSEGI